MNLKTWANKNKVPTVEYLTSKALKYIEGKDWYLNSNKIIKEYYPKDFNLFIDILSITSPLTNVKLNLTNTIKTVDIIKYKRTNNIIYGLANKGIRTNLAKYNKTGLFGGVKINNFSGSLRLKNGHVCIDTWVLKAFNIKHRSPTKYDIQHITSIVKDISDRLGLKTYEVQACLWIYAKTEINGTRFKESHDFSYYLKEHFEQTNLKMWME